MSVERGKVSGKIVMGTAGLASPSDALPPSSCLQGEPLPRNSKGDSPSSDEENAGADGTTETPVCRADFTFLY